MKKFLGVRGKIDSIMGKLYVVSTPIGNLTDMTFRAVEVLKKVKLIAAEDTRQTRKLLSHYQIETLMTAYHEHNELTKIKKIIDVLKLGDVALVSDAGTPGIADPGYKLICEVIENGFRVIPIPGANAAVSALVVSGLPTDSYVFLGFLPKKKSARKQALKEVEGLKKSLIIYESPFRIEKLLREIQAVLGNRRVVIARELTKKFEEVIRGDAESLKKYLKKNKVAGEVVMVVEGKKEDVVWGEEKLKSAVREKLNKSKGLKDTAKELAEKSGWRKGEVYKIGLDMKSEV